MRGSLIEVLERARFFVCGLAAAVREPFVELAQRSHLPRWMRRRGASRPGRPVTTFHVRASIVVPLRVSRAPHERAVTAANDSGTE